MKQPKQCNQCGECCRYFAVKRVVKTKDIVDYVTAHGYTFDGSTILIPSVCPNLTEDNKCRIYDTRPKLCRSFGVIESSRSYYPVGCAFRK